MVISKQKILDAISETIIKTSEACGRKLSLKQQFIIKEFVLKKLDKNGVANK